MQDDVAPEGSPAAVEFPLFRLHAKVLPASALRFWALVSVLFAITCFGNERWQILWEWFPSSLQRYFTAPPGYWHAFEATVYLCVLALLVLPVAPVVWRAICARAERQDFRLSLMVMLGLMVLVLVTRPSSLGVDYAAMSLDPFNQPTGVLHRRLLALALSYFTHLNGALFILLHFGMVCVSIVLLRIFLRLQGVEVGFLGLLSISTSAFMMHNFQYPGYPDVLVVIIALVFLLVDVGAYGRLILATLALLTHEALAVAVIGPLVFFLPPSERWRLVVLAGVYGGFWLGNLGFDGAGAVAMQVNYQGYSGLALLMERPLVVLFGILISFKVLWVVILAYLRGVWREKGARAMLRVALPVLSGVGLCIISYDTSRMAGMAFVTLLFALVACWHKMSPGMRTALLVVNLLVPSLYVSPIWDNALGIKWAPGLYSAYNGFEWKGARMVPPVVPKVP